MNYRIGYFMLLLISFTAVHCSSSRGAAKTNPPENSREALLRKDIARYATKFKGIRYKYAGKKPSTGFDCSGFTSYVMDNYDIALSPSSSMQSTQGRKIRQHQAKAGDLVFFRRKGSTRVFHVALVLDTTPNSITVIHATSSRGVIVEDILKSSYWKPKISEFRDVISGA